MTAFTYRNGVLCADNVPLPEIAAQVGTPFYVYSETQLRENFRLFHEPLADLKPLICYAIKANANTAVARVLVECGAGVDITSGGELERALKAGADPQKIIFSGVAKSRDELAAALKVGIYQINVESIPELKMLSEVAVECGAVAPVGLRVNPDVAAHTNEKIATGKKGVKFGIDAEQLDEAMALAHSLPGLSFKGFQVHIGSHLDDYDDFRQGFGVLAQIVEHWRGKGYAVERLDLGGGVGIAYDGQTQSPFAKYAQIVHETLGSLGCKIAFEPGRRLVGDAGAMVASVTYDKRGASTRFLIIDAGMNDLVRPAMYDAWHDFEAVQPGGETFTANVVGPICESSDTFAMGRTIDRLQRGDLAVFRTAGAYGATMASSYNSRGFVAEVMVDGDKFAVVADRILPAEITAAERVPDFLNG